LLCARKATLEGLVGMDAILILLKFINLKIISMEGVNEKKVRPKFGRKIHYKNP